MDDRDGGDCMKCVGALDDVAEAVAAEEDEGAIAVDVDNTAD